MPTDTKKVAIKQPDPPAAEIPTEIIADAILSNTPEFSTTNSGRIPVTKVSEAREIVRAALLRALGGDQNG